MHTSKLLIGLTLVASIANAQGTAPAATASTAAPVQTSVADAAAAKPVTASKFGVSASYETVANVGDLKSQNEKAPIDALGTVGLSYKATPTLKLQVTHIFAAPIISDSAQIEATSAKGESAPYKTLDPTIHANVTTEASLLGSKPLTIASRYYVPVTKSSVDAGSNGILRTQTTADWDLNPKVTLSAHAQARLSMFNGRGTAGSDSKLRLIFNPSATYNFSDKLNVYYGPWTDMVTTGHQRGNLTMDQRNHIWQDIGANISAGSLTINPVWSTKAEFNGSDAYEGAGSDANSEYQLNLYATF